MVAILLPPLRLLIRFRWQAKEYLPRTGGVILAPNHLSYADWPALITGAGDPGRAVGRAGHPALRVEAAASMLTSRSAKPEWYGP
jgi:1-acyl-sn-glycerol-3-phosphate acyltransferase